MRVKLSSLNKDPSGLDMKSIPWNLIKNIVYYRTVEYDEQVIVESWIMVVFLVVIDLSLCSHHFTHNNVVIIF